MIEITPIPCLSDNYAYLVRCGATGAVAVVDPSEPGALLAALDARGMRPAMVLNTHHHHDHVGGNEGLAERYPGLRVVAHASDRGRVPAQTDAVEHGGTVTLGDLTLRALHVPGHTMGAIAWHVDGAVFTGDTLFLAGCGRLFEGTASMMRRSLVEVLGALDPGTRVYCGHEYTVKNLRFARSVSPDDPEVLAALARAESLRERDLPTVPGTLAEERRVNPFLRAPDVERFAALRERRNTF